MPPDAPHENRFDRQVRFAELGADGQAALERSRVLLVGCGALGGVLAQTLTRAGVGELVLVDRDVVELSNLPRQVLFDEHHAREASPKAHAAAEALARCGGPTRVEAHAEHLDAGNAARLAEGCDLVLDGTDNMSTRYLLNDLCVESGRPWVYGGVVGGGGLVLPVLPGHGACLRCVFPEPPPPGVLPTCDSAGVILPAVGLVASLQAGYALRVLAHPERRADVEPALVQLDAWTGEVHRIGAPRRPDCPCCGGRDFPFLHRPRGGEAVVLCGRNTVQVPARGEAPDLASIAARLDGVASDLRRAGPMLRFRVETFAVTVFPDGRALIEGTDEAERALAVYDRYVGS
jgi:adenylyltransferase/sulfurtransferase